MWVDKPLREMHAGLRLRHAKSRPQTWTRLFLPGARPGRVLQQFYRTLESSGAHWHIMRIPLPVVTALAALMLPFPAGARLTRHWSDAELLEKSDLIVVGLPLAVADTGESVPLPETPAAKAAGVTTRFAVYAVVKGDRGLKEVTLFHARLADAAASPPNGPLLAEFDPAKKDLWLLYLARGADGKLVPVTGQADPALQAVVPVKPPRDSEVPIPPPPAAETQLDPDKAAKATVVLQVQYLSASGSDKYGWTKVRLLHVLKNDCRHAFPEEFEIAHLGTEPGIPDGICTVYLERYRADADDLWKLLGGSAKQGVSHSRTP